MAVLKRTWWQKFLYGTEEVTETEQTYWNTHRTNHNKNEHGSGIVSGLGVAEKSPASLLVAVALGRALDANGDVITIAAQDVNLTAFVPGAATQLVYIVAKFTAVASDSYYVPELGTSQNKFYTDTPLIVAQITAPGAADIEIARVVIAAGATQIEDAADPLNPGNDEINTTNCVYIGKFVTNAIGGLITSNGTETEHDIDIAKGSCRDDADTIDMVLSAGITKQLDATWAVGDDAGGLDTGAVGNNTLYAVWLIKRPDTGVVDVLFSDSFTSPTMPVGYTKKRLLAGVKTEGSANIVQYIQSCDYFRYMSVREDLSDTVANMVWETGTLGSVPPNCLATIYGSTLNTGDNQPNGRFHIVHTGATLTDEDAHEQAFIGEDYNGNVYNGQTVKSTVLVDGSSQVKYTGTKGAGTLTLKITTIGFQMLTRRDP